jgi:CBS domain-containing protein
MHVSDVLAAKGRRVETVWPAQTAKDVLGMLVDRGHSSVIVVSADGAPIGIVTDRDLLTAMARREGDFARLSARDVMTSPPPVCRPSDGIVEVLNRMTDERVRHLLVMDQGRMAGVVSIGDLVKYRFRDTDLEMRVLRDMALARMGRSEVGYVDRAE